MKRPRPGPRWPAASGAAKQLQICLEAPAAAAMFPWSGTRKTMAILAAVPPLPLEVESISRPSSPPSSSLSMRRKLPHRSTPAPHEPSGLCAPTSPSKRRHPNRLTGGGRSSSCESPATRPMPPQVPGGGARLPHTASSKTRAQPKPTCCSQSGQSMRTGATVPRPVSIQHDNSGAHLPGPSGTVNDCALPTSAILLSSHCTCCSSVSPACARSTPSTRHRSVRWSTYLQSSGHRAGVVGSVAASLVSAR
mmetsp:Transcript_111335/g.359422  ORF Transcript_111335/g.359422 Transcript_111335/m.359422 type:complete len:250 (-) Transcript_111335:217-966(-)